MDTIATKRLAQSAIEIRGRLGNSSRDAARLALRQAGYEFGYGGLETVVKEMGRLKPKPKPLRIDTTIKMCSRLPYPEQTDDESGDES